MKERTWDEHDRRRLRAHTRATGEGHPDVTGWRWGGSDRGDAELQMRIE